jgi:hypothetical protein
MNGNVLARESSRLYVSNTRVAGNIDGVEARVVQVKGGSLEGSIQIAHGSSAGELGAAVYGGTVLTQGNIQIIKMNTGSINKNRGSGAKAVKNNRVFQIVQCKENGSPFTGGPNAAAEAEGQCF